MGKLRIGIDLGTTNTLACYMKNSKPEIIKFPGGKMLPSVLYLEEDGTVLVGEKARKKGISDPLNCIRSSKTDMGNFNKSWTLRGRRFSPTDVATEILKEVKKAVIKKTKSNEDIEIEAVITVPAYFTSNQIDETKRAGERAGLKVLGIAAEPRAAAIANIKELGISEQKICVLDLGGGTFDVSVLEANKMQYKTIAVDGDRHLGGDDFDERLVSYIRNYVEDELGLDLGSVHESGLGYNEYYSMLGRICDGARDGKEALSEAEECDISLPNLFTYKNENYSLDITITREQFYVMCEELFERVRNRVCKVFSENEELSIENIDNVILAGGSCYIPKIKDDMEKLFSMKADATIDRSTMVVMGACFIADTWDDISVEQNDIISHSLGVEAVREDGTLVLIKILNRGEIYPCKKTHIFSTSEDNQESVFINIYEAGSDKEEIEEIERQDGNGNLIEVHDFYGSFALNGIQKEKKGIPKIEVTFEYDRSRLLTVTAIDMVTKAKKSVAVTKGIQIKQKKTQVVPIDFALLIDTSGSMRGERIEQAKSASIKLIRDIIDLKIHRVGLIGFGEKIQELSAMSQNVNHLICSIDKLDPYGGTYMDQAIEKGIELLGKSNRRKVILMVTDGLPDNSKKASAIANKAKAAGIDIITVAVGVTIGGEYLQTIASKLNLAFTIDTMEQLADIFEKAVSQYLAIVNN